MNNRCSNCGIQTHTLSSFCDVCQSAVERPFFIKAQQEFYEENRQRIRTKERLLHESE